MTAVFDLDGTLVDTLGDLAAATNHALSVCGYPPHTRDEYRFLVGRGARRLMEGALPEEERSEETIDRMRSLFNAYYSEHFLDASRPYDGIPEALDALREKGVTLAVLSNKPDVFTGRMVRTLLGDRFAAVFGQREGIPLKPDPTAVREVLQLCGAGADGAVYVGDSDVGEGVNFGCGCVTANYDGIQKFRTKIGNNAFIGCNTNLIAPVEVGENASTGAGSTITRNVPPNSLVVERAEPKVVQNWEKNKMRKRR